MIKKPIKIEKFVEKPNLEKAKEYLSTVSTPESSEKEITLHNLRTEMLGCAQFDWAINKLENGGFWNDKS